MTRVSSLVLLILFAFNSALFAQEVELHVVGVYEGNEKTGERIHGPEVHVRVERTDVPVVLALTSYEAVQWKIETASDVEISDVFVGGYDGKESEVYINDTVRMATVLEGNTYSYRAGGKPFRTLVTALTEKVGVAQLASMSGAYRPEPNQVFVIDGPSPVLQLRPDYLADLVRPDALPVQWGTLLDTPRTPVVRFTEDGFVMIADGANVQIPISLDVPRVSWPVGAAFDADRNRIYGVTLGGAGYLYQYDMVSELWSVVTSMDNNDAAGMLYDAVSNRLIMGSNGGRSPAFLTYDFEGELSNVAVDAGTLHGYTDLFDIGNGPAVPLLPIAVQGDTLLAQAGGRTPLFGSSRSSLSSRTYVIDMKTGRATLVTYHDSMTR